MVCSSSSGGHHQINVEGSQVDVRESGKHLNHEIRVRNIYGFISTSVNIASPL